MTDFSVIIPTYRDWDRLNLCIKRLVDQENDGIDFEIIVVNNDAEHRPPDYFENYVNRNVTIIHEPTPGSYAARNTGAKLAKGEYLAFTDADCLPDKQWLFNANKVFEKTNCDLIGGRIDLFKPVDGGDWAFIYEKNTSFRQHIHVEQGKSVTANLLMKRDVFKSLNGFDHALKSGGDWEFTERAVNNGFRMVYGDDVIVQHPSRKSIRKILKKQKRFAAWGYLNVKNRHGHSGFRIIGSNLMRGTPAAFKSVKYPDKITEKLIVLLISLEIHVFKIALKILFLLKLLDPEKIRE